MKSFGQYIRDLRITRGRLLKEVAADIEIDPSLLSRIETGIKRPTRDLVVRISRALKANEKDLLIHYLSDRVVYTLKDERFALEVIQVAEEKINHIRKKKR